MACGHQPEDFVRISSRCLQRLRCGSLLEEHRTWYRIQNGPWVASSRCEAGSAPDTEWCGVCLHIKSCGSCYNSPKITHENNSNGKLMTTYDNTIQKATQKATEQKLPNKPHDGTLNMIHQNGSIQLNKPHSYASIVKKSVKTPLLALPVPGARNLFPSKILQHSHHCKTQNMNLI